MTAIAENRKQDSKAIVAIDLRRKLKNEFTGRKTGKEHGKINNRSSGRRVGQGH